MNEDTFQTLSWPDRLDNVDWTILYGKRFEVDGISYNRHDDQTYPRLMFEFFSATHGGDQWRCEAHRDIDERAWLTHGEITFTDETWRHQ